jgi:hypothetical protein
MAYNAGNFNEWKLREEYTNCNGLTVLERVDTK